VIIVECCVICLPNNVKKRLWRSNKISRQKGQEGVSKWLLQVTESIAIVIVKEDGIWIRIHHCLNSEGTIWGGCNGGLKY
jgi:hypothetical protein